MNISRTDHYPVAWESATVCGLNTYFPHSESLSGFWKRRSEPRTRPQIDTEISGQTLIPCSYLFLMCTVCVAVRGHIISFSFWSGFLAVKYPNYSIMFIHFLEALEFYGNKIRAVPGFLFWGWHKPLDLNSIKFGNNEYTAWNTIGKNIKITRYCMLFCDINNHIPTARCCQSEKSVECYIITNTNQKYVLYAVFVNAVSRICNNCGEFDVRWFSFCERIDVYSTINFNVFNWITVIKMFICLY